MPLIARNGPADAAPVEGLRSNPCSASLASLAENLSFGAHGIPSATWSWNRESRTEMAQGPPAWRQGAPQLGSNDAMPTYPRGRGPASTVCGRLAGFRRPAPTWLWDFRSRLAAPEEFVELVGHGLCGSHARCRVFRP